MLLGSGLIAFQLLPFIKHLSVIDRHVTRPRPALHLALPTMTTSSSHTGSGSPVAGSSGHGNYFFGPKTT